MAETFHLFGQLPWELRNDIWNLVVRPPQPGAHIFQIYNARKDEGVGVEEDVAFSDYRYHEIRLAAPKGESRHFSRNIDRSLVNPVADSRYNPSIYQVDGGLWTACKESRLVMEREFKNQEWNTIRRKDRQILNYCRDNRPDIDNMTATGYFARQGLKDHCFTVFPHRDLFILQPYNLETIKWDQMDDDVPIGSTLWGFQGLRNIALEFNRSWGTVLDNAETSWENPEIVEHFIKMAFGLGEQLRSIWFIDYGIKRKHRTSTQEPLERQDAEVFHLSDRRFTEVLTSEDGEEIWDEKYEVDYSKMWDGVNSCRRFVNSIEGAVRDRFIDDATSRRIVARTGSFVDMEVAHFGVLACEYY